MTQSEADAICNRMFDRPVQARPTIIYVPGDNVFKLVLRVLDRRKTQRKAK